MAYENITVDRRGRVGLITLNRPKALNALNGALIDELNAVLDSFEADEEIGAVVITGNEKAFAAGADITEMRSMSFVDAHGSDFIAKWNRITAFRKPVVAAIAGYALGGGCELAMMCDIAIAGRQREIRPAGNQARRHPRRRRHPAPHPRRRQVEGDGDGPDRAHDECRGGRAQRAR